MFEYFFGEYKRSIYHGSIKVLRSPWEGLCAIFFFLAYVAFATGLAFAVSSGSVFAFAISFAVLAVDIVGAYRWLDKRLEKTQDMRMREYQEKKLHPLIKLLKDDKFSFYSVNKVEWLISCCEVQLEREKNPFKNLPDSFFKWVFPIITMFLGAHLDNLARDAATATAILFTLSLLWMIVYLLKNLVSGVIDYLLFPNRKVLLFLKSELKYIRILLEDSKTNVTDSKNSQDDSEKAPEMATLAGT